MWNFHPFWLPLLFHHRVHMWTAFEMVGKSLGWSTSEIAKLFALLPDTLRLAPVGWNEHTCRWHYDFGVPYQCFYTGQLLYGEPQAPSLERLLNALLKARTWLDEQDLPRYLNNLGIRLKHPNYLEESVPLMHLRPGTRVMYEVPGAGEKKLDFRFERTGFQPVVIDVKFRSADIKHHIGSLGAGGDNSEDSIPAPNPKWTFTKIIEKLEPCAFETRAQGAWIHAQVAQFETDLRSCFYAFDPARLHFCVLCSEPGRGHILARTPEIERFVREYFSLAEAPLVLRESS